MNRSRRQSGRMVSTSITRIRQIRPALFSLLHPSSCWRKSECFVQILYEDVKFSSVSGYLHARNKSRSTVTRAFSSAAKSATKPVSKMKENSRKSVQVEAKKPRRLSEVSIWKYVLCLVKLLFLPMKGFRPLDLNRNEVYSFQWIEILFCKKLHW